jgi:hypothetical protein
LIAAEYFDATIALASGDKARAAAADAVACQGLKTGTVAVIFGSKWHIEKK